MEVADFLAVMGSAVGLSSAGALWLSRTLVQQMLQKDLETRKIELQARFDSQKAELEGTVKERVENALADKAASRQYEFEARKRLYLAIGPIRFQLLLACRDLAGRIQGYGRGRQWATKVENYFGRSTLFIVLKPLALVELAEREIAYSDFAVDSAAINLLRFKKQAFAVFSGGSLVEGHPMVDWENQRQHVFFQNISKAANAIVMDADKSCNRCMRFNEFESSMETETGVDAIAPFPELFANFSIKDMPLFWIRLVAYGYLCNEYVNRNGSEIGFQVREFPLIEMLQKSEDATIKSNIEEYADRCRRITVSPL